jgi:hypothetical protein
MEGSVSEISAPIPKPSNNPAKQAALYLVASTEAKSPDYETRKQERRQTNCKSSLLPARGRAFCHHHPFPVRGPDVVCFSSKILPSRPSHWDRS